MFLNTINKEIYVKLYAYFKLGYRKFDLKNPITFNEKINHRKLYTYNHLFFHLSNKLTVRNYLKSFDLVGLQLKLIPLLAVIDDSRKLLYNSLPNSFVIKTTHGSGGHHTNIIMDKTKINFTKLKSNLNLALNENYAKLSGEYWYDQRKKYLLIEELLKYKKNYNEYKVYCFWDHEKFNSFVRIIDNRFKAKKSIFFDSNFKKIDFSYNGNKEYDMPMKPYNFDQVVYISKMLSIPFDHVRIDFIEVDETLYFGEFTFADTSGFIKFRSISEDLDFGKYWKLRENGINL
jgi:hypothetical protein